MQSFIIFSDTKKLLEAVIEKKFKSFEDEVTRIIQTALNGYENLEKTAHLANEFLKYAAALNFGKSSESNLLRIFDALFDKTAFFLYCLKYPHHIEIILLISNYSNYLTEIIIRNPEFLHQIFNEEYLSEKITFNTQNQLNKNLGFYKSFNSKVNYLKTFKRREFLRIGTNDILSRDSLQSTAFELSKLANIIISALFDLCSEQVEKEICIEKQPCRYAICSLGKLGGMELNYSSDIDLIIFYENDIPAVVEEKIEYQKYLEKIIHLFIETMTTISDKGFLYRVDFRLRPDGKHAPLCRPINEYLRYYETRGEEWERQMLIKANFVSGNHSLYRQFINYLTPYIYPKSFSLNIFSTITKFKTIIEQQNNERLNIKLCSGGIRDIEFSIQGLQLLNGGKIAQIRGGNSLETIAQLEKFGLLKSLEAQVFTDSYLFLRKIEHFLQLMNDRQTHEIPLNDAELLLKLARFTNFATSESFLQFVEETRVKVREIFNSIINYEDDSQPDFLNIFSNKPKAEKSLKYLKYGSGIMSDKKFDSRTISLFDVFYPHLQIELRKTHSPDLVLENLVKVIQSVPFPSMWYREFSDIKFLQPFLKICNFSQRSINILSTNKFVGEVYISRMVFTKNIIDSFEKLKPETLVFILSVQFSLKLINQQKVSEILCIYFSNTINNIASKIFLKNEIFIAGAGSFGNFEMSFASDLDLIFCVKKNTPEIQQKVVNFLDIFKKTILPFKFDLRLRPEGHKGALIWDMKTFEIYLQKRIRIWEIQSLHKTRLIFGNVRLFNKFKLQICSHLVNLDKSFVASEIKLMRNLINKQSFSTYGGVWNIKKDRGGLNEIEFILHFLLITNPRWYSVTMGKSNSFVFNALLKETSFDWLKTLKQNYLQLKSIGLANQTIFDANKYILKQNDESINLVAAFYEFGHADKVKETIIAALKLNSKMFDEILATNE